MAYGIGNIEYLITREDYTPPAPEEPPPDPEPPPIESLFTSQVPASTGLIDSTYTLGTTFKSDVDGQILGVRVYVGELPSNGPIGALYERIDETTGTLLAQKAFGTLTPFSWNEVLFDTPVDILAGQYYTTCWTTNNYNTTANFFEPVNGDLVNGHLTAPRKQVGLVSNGKFHVGTALQFPDEEFNGSCYFVDTLFQPPVGA